MNIPSKICATCGRKFAYRRRWARCWDQVRYCSERCRRQRPGRVDERLEDAILGLLADRASGATICPSEAARRVGGDRWRRLNERTRSAARRLAGRREIEILQGGRVVQASDARGPIRLRRT